MRQLAPPTASRADLVAVSSARVFFAHQSVGRGVLDALPRVYAAHDLTPPPVTELADADPGDQWVHTLIGENGDAIGKVEEYAAVVRGGVGDWADVAILKFCYSDVRADTNVAEVCTAYHETLTALGEEYPDVAFVAATVPLTTQLSLTGTLKQRLGRGGRHGPAHNLAREEFNALLREQHASPGHLFDIASLESTTAGGRPITGRHRGQMYHALDRARARDHGHLNDIGGEVVATGLLATIATALRG